MANVHHGLSEMTAPQRVGLRQSLWWMVFLADTVTLSMVLQHFKTFTLTPSLTNGGWLALSLASLILFTGALVYDGYAKEKQKGNLKNPFGLFDWIYRQQTGEPPASSLMKGTTHE